MFCKCQALLVPVNVRLEICIDMRSMGTWHTYWSAVPGLKICNCLQLHLKHDIINFPWMGCQQLHCMLPLHLLQHFLSEYPTAEGSRGDTGTHLHCWVVTGSIIKVSVLPKNMIHWPRPALKLWELDSPAWANHYAMYGIYQDFNVG